MSYRMESSLRSCCCFLMVFAFFVFAHTVQGKLTCDPKFKASVEDCFTVMDGFPVLGPTRTLVFGNWSKTHIICKWKLMSTASVCVQAVYDQCPHTRAYRSLCGFQGLDPELVLNFGDVVCQHKEVLQRNARCLNGSFCDLKTCLDSFDASLPAHVSAGMWKYPVYSAANCRYHAYVEHCYEKSTLAECSEDFNRAHMDVLNVTRPASCSPSDIERLKRHFQDNHVYVIPNSNWSLISSCSSLIGCLLLCVLLVGVSS